jgi:hypothetical protein
MQVEGTPVIRNASGAQTYDLKTCFAEGVYTKHRRHVRLSVSGFSFVYIRKNMDYHFT